MNRILMTLFFTPLLADAGFVRVKDFPGSCTGLVDEVIAPFKVGQFERPAKNIDKKKSTQGDGELRYTFSPAPGLKPFDKKNSRTFVDVLEMNGGVSVMIHGRQTSGSVLEYDMKPKGTGCEMRSLDLDLVSASGKGSSGFTISVDAYTCKEVMHLDKIQSSIRGTSKNETASAVISANQRHIIRLCTKHFPSVMVKGAPETSRLGTTPTVEPTPERDAQPSGNTEKN